MCAVGEPLVLGSCIVLVNGDVRFASRADLYDVLVQELIHYFDDTTAPILRKV